MTIEELQVVITANTSGVTNALSRLGPQFNSINAAAEKSAKGMKAGFAATGKVIATAGKAIAIGLAGGAVALAGMVIKASEYCAAIDDVAQRTNLSAKTVQEFKYAAEQSGIGMEAIESAAKKLTVSMGKVGEGNADAIENFKKLGVAVKDSNGNLLTTDQVMPNVIDKLAGMNNITERNALGIKIFGKGFMDMAPMLADGAKGVQAFKDEAGKLGLVLSDESIAAGAKFDDTMVKVKSSMGMVTTVIGNKVMPIVQKMMDWVITNMPQIQSVTSKVFSVVGKAIGIAADVITKVILPAFKSFWDWISPYMPQIKAIVTKAFDNIKSAIGTAMDFIKPKLETAKEVIGKVVDVLVKIGVWASEHQTAMQNIGIIVGSFAAAWGLVNLALGIWAVVGAIATAVTTGLTAASTALATAMAFLTSPMFLIVLAIGAVIAIGVLLYKNWDTIKEWAAKVFPAIWNTIKGAFAGVIAFFAGIWNGIKKVFSVVKDVFLGFFTLAWNAIKAYIGLWVAVFQGVWNGIKKVFSVVKSVLTGFFNDAWTGIKGVFNGVGKFFGGIWDTIKTKFTDIGSVIGDAIGGAFKKVVNSVIGFAEKTINGFIRAINNAIGMINKIPGVDISRLSLLSIPKLARGGVVNSGQIYQAGEAGKEAIVPLEHNLGWINGIADKLSTRMPQYQSQQQSNSSGPTTLILQVGSTELGRVVIDSINSLQQQQGKILLNI